MGWKKRAGIGLIITGVIMIVTVRVITGAVIGTFSSNFLGLLGILILVAGVVLVLTTDTLEDLREKTLEDVVDDIRSIVSEQRIKYRANPVFLKGLDEIEDRTNRIKEKFYSVEVKKSRDSHYRENLINKLERWKEGLKLREKSFFEVPRHVKSAAKGGKPEVIDVPDYSLYGYHPLGGRKSKYIELDVVHYTKHNSYRRMKNAFRTGKKDVMFLDETGWTYFVSGPLPEKLSVRAARRVLGIGMQPGKEVHRDPEYEIRFRIRVPKERVFVKTERYRVGNKRELEIKKYAIAGGVRKNEIIGTPVGKRYVSKNLPEEHSKKEGDRWDSS